MFTGIIECLGTVRDIYPYKDNIKFTIEAPFTSELKVDQSVSHNGVCLTVEEISGDSYEVSAIQETLKKTNLGDWKVGDSVNLERSMKIGGRLRLLWGNRLHPSLQNSTAPSQRAWIGGLQIAWRWRRSKD